VCRFGNLVTVGGTERLVASVRRGKKIAIQRSDVDDNEGYECRFFNTSDGFELKKFQADLSPKTRLAVWMPNER
jgi:hypothetical protein